MCVYVCVGRGGEWEREGGGKGWGVEEEKEGKGERVCVWARERKGG